MSAKELAWSFPFSLSVTAPLGFEDDPYDGAIGFKASLPSCRSSCFEESPVFLLRCFTSLLFTGAISVCLSIVSLAFKRRVAGWGAKFTACA